MNQLKKWLSTALIIAMYITGFGLAIQVVIGDVLGIILCIFLLMVAFVTQSRLLKT